MKLKSSSTLEEQILHQIHTACHDHLKCVSSEALTIQGLIAVTVNTDDVFVININNKLQSQVTIAELQASPTPSDTKDIQNDSHIIDLSREGEGEQTDAEITDVSETDHAQDSANHKDEDTAVQNNAKSAAEADREGSEDQPQVSSALPTSSSDVDLQIVRHHQRRKRTYTNSKMSIKREPPDVSNRLSKNLDFSTSYLSAFDIEGLEHLISQDKESLNLSFKDELVAQLGIDMDETLEGSIVDSATFSRWQHMTEFTCRECGKLCSSAGHLEKHRLSHTMRDLATSEEIDIDLTQDDDQDDHLNNEPPALGTGGQHKPDTFHPSLNTGEQHCLDSLSDNMTEHHTYSNQNSCDDSDIVEQSTNTLPSNYQSVDASQQEPDNENSLNSLCNYNSSELQPTRKCSTPKSKGNKMKVKDKKCSYCDKMFQRTQHLNEHLLTHTLEKPHHCEFCRKKYRLKSHLNRHVQQCH